MTHFSKTPFTHAIRRPPAPARQTTQSPRPEKYDGPLPVSGRLSDAAMWIIVQICGPVTCNESVTGRRIDWKMPRPRGESSGVLMARSPRFQSSLPAAVRTTVFAYYGTIADSRRLRQRTMPPSRPARFCPWVDRHVERRCDRVRPIADNPGGLAADSRMNDCARTEQRSSTGRRGPAD